MDLPGTPEPLPDGVRVTTVDFPALVEGEYFKALQEPDVVKARYEKGHKCIAVYVHDQLAHVVWLTVGHLPIDTGVPDLVLDGIGGAFDGFTRPDLRGHRALNHAVAYMRVIASEIGLTRVLGVIQPDNAASLHIFNKLGFDVIGDVVYRRTLGFETFTYPDDI